ncbi:MAG: xanthine dehydrogenase family protein subunit M [Burkholderiales bacterium]|nr:xanthine dehydrogenase family protein subunit M [Burkholderiales bacterium]
MTPFELIEPRTLDEALRLLDPADPGVRPAGGCTALMLMMKAGMLVPTRLVSLRRIEPRYRDIVASDDAITIGANASLASIEHSARVRDELPALARTLRTLANVRVRNVATLGGNLAHADPHMDLPPLLAALDASVQVQGRGSSRYASIEQLISGYYETTLAGDELIVAVRIPKRAARGCAYRKVTTRSADDWPALGIAVALEREGERVRAARVVLGAAVDRPTRLLAAEAALQGTRLDETSARRAADAAADEARPSEDARGSAAYKRELIRVHVRRTLLEAWCDEPVGAVRQ